MLLLHLSDIHFRREVVGTNLDPDLHIRNEILRDVEKMCAQLGAVDAILISGDIGFGGHSDEYKFAANWLEKKLCRVCACKFSNIFTCPGNHDVVRAAASRQLIQALHNQIKAAGDFVIDSTLSGLLRDKETARLLYEPLDAYNLFAGQFFCDLLPPDRTVAKRDLTLNDGSTLRLWGLNSAFVSSSADKPQDLFVDPACYQIVKTSGVENLVMCHHPYHWLRTGRALKDFLDDVARIQLFGHEHRNRIEMGRDWVRLAAAAVHPDRTEPGWEPGYNLMCIEVTGVNTDRHLKFEGHLRVWQGTPGQFIPKFDRGSEPIFREMIHLDPWQPAAPAAEAILPLEITPAAQDHPPAASADVARSDSMSTLREISVRFFKLNLSQKSEIAGKLGLLDDEDVNLPDFERFRRVFIRARERGKTEALAHEVTAATADTIIDDATGRGST